MMKRAHTDSNCNTTTDGNINYHFHMSYLNILKTRTMCELMHSNGIWSGIFGSASGMVIVDLNLGCVRVTVHYVLSINKITSIRYVWGFCVVIRFFHPRHKGQWTLTSKDFHTRFYPLLFYPHLNSSERASISFFNVECQTRELLVPFL